MVQNFHIPPSGFGPGSQPAPEDGAELEYLALPSGMRTYSAHLPDSADTATHAPALAVLADIADHAERVASGADGVTLDLTGLDANNRELVAETLGEGEVSIKMRGVPALAAQESVFAGVWQIKGAGVDVVEIAPVPKAALTRAFAPVEPALGPLAPRTPDVVNAPPLIAELMDKSAGFVEGALPHVVNLSLLPHTEGDLAYLDTALGTGSVTILSRGYGNCRVTATGQTHVWRVQFFNSMDTLILDTFEVTTMPEVAMAAPEDLADSAARIREVLEAIR